MLRKISGARIDRNSHWYQGGGLNLTIWQRADQPPSGFEVEYLHKRSARAVRWHRRQGLSHYLVDDGESQPGRHKASPLLQPDNVAPLARLHQSLRQQTGEVPPALIDFLCRKLSRSAAG